MTLTVYTSPMLWEPINRLTSLVPAKSGIGFTGAWSRQQLEVHPITAEGSRLPPTGRTGPRLGNATSGLVPWHPQNLPVARLVLL